MAASIKEKHLLREFFLQGNDTIEVPLKNPVVSGLLYKNILKIVSQNYNSYIFGTYVFVGLNEKIKCIVTPKFLGLPEGKPSHSQLETIKSNRPDLLVRSG